MDSSPRPNVLVFICDDLAWGDLSAHGNPHIQTPNLDALRKSGVRFEHYCSGPLCSPARAGIMTGRYHPRTRVIDTYCGRSIIDPNERTIAHVLGDADYQCGAFGKWHLGDCYPSRACDMGFHHTVMHNAGGIGQPGDHPDNFARFKTDGYFDPVLFRNGVPSKHKGYCTDIFVDEAIAFMDEARKQDTPFFAYVATNAPHTPLIIGEEWVRPFREAGLNDAHARVYGMVANIDHNVGRLVQWLEENELRENTILIFTSDHGPCGSANDPNEGTRYNADLRDIKGSMYQGGVRVPFFCSYPARGREGEAFASVSSPIDVLPTLSKLCGIELAKDGPGIDGVDLSGAILKEAEAPSQDRQIVMQWHRGDMPVPYRNYAVIGNRYKLTRPQEDAPDELYDLAEDPREAHNLATEQPERVQAMRAHYEAWFHDVSGTRSLTTFDPPAIITGSEHENPTLLTTNDWHLVEGEGWLRDDLRGVWRVRNVSNSPFRVRILFNEAETSNTATLRINDDTHESTKRDKEGWFLFPKVALPQGQMEIEAWRESLGPNPSLVYLRYQPALYIELKRLS